MSEEEASSPAGAVFRSFLLSMSPGQSIRDFITEVDLGFNVPTK